MNNAFIAGSCTAIRTFLFNSMLGGAPCTRRRALIGMIMEELLAFQNVAREGGFVEAKKSNDSTVLWLRKAAPDGSTGAPQRLCLDSVTSSATVFWTNARGLTYAKTFRTVPALRDWLSGIPVSG